MKFINLFIWLIFTATISSCSSASFKASQGTRELNTSWVVVKDVQQVCQAITNGPANNIYNGCATWDRKHLQCTIFTGELVTNELLGHELRHCFYGDFHLKPSSE